VAEQEEESRPLNQVTSSEYNTVFERLSGANSPLAGAVAYALYKNAKRQWIQEFRERHSRRPTPEECNHHTATQTDAVLLAYMSQADQILAQYAQDVIKAERPRILEAALKGEGWRSFWISFWASAAFAAVLTVIVIVAAISGVGLPIQFNIGSKPPASAQISN
jgi:hypothetical protein